MMKWVLFHILIAALLMLDLGFFHRRKREMKMREALGWSCFWIALSLGFNAYIYITEGPERALEFFTGYLVEKSLSVDNLFIFLIVFSYFKVPKIYQHHVLYAGIIGALAMRLVLILGGVALLNWMHYVIYFFALFLAYTGIELILRKDRGIEPEEKWVIKVARRLIPFTKNYHDGKYFVDGKATQLFLVFLVIESTDFIFAFDSIPAIFAITLHPFIIYTSNVFAILGLRSLYFVLAGFLEKFHYLKIGLGVLLLFIALKMGLTKIYPIPLGVSLLVIALILSMTIICSLLTRHSNR